MRWKLQDLNRAQVLDGIRDYTDIGNDRLVMEIITPTRVYVLFLPDAEAMIDCIDRAVLTGLKAGSYVRSWMIVPVLKYPLGIDHRTVKAVLDNLPANCLVHKSRRNNNSFGDMRAGWDAERNNKHNHQ